MKYVALLSGGKDSCFNLLHCKKNGHELVVAASLGPGIGIEELDSHLYQTVGQDAIEFVARALDVPLFRRVITGRAVHLGLDYGSRNSFSLVPSEEDETEDLLALLLDVKLHHPDIEGLSVGTILSSYQRARVEHVCRRLGLTPLSYLWKREQGELLDEMIDFGIEAIIIKIAGVGLTTQHLGNTLREMRPILFQLNDLYGAHICGEGGEYESLTLDCPLFKHRLRLEEVETVLHSDQAFATVAFLRIKKVELEPKQFETNFPLRIPPSLNKKYRVICDEIFPESEKALDIPLNDVPPTVAFEGITGAIKVGPWVSISNIQRQRHDVDLSIGSEVEECLIILRDELATLCLALSNCVNINIFLSSMDLFQAVNDTYNNFFGSCPPARACVSTDLPRDIRIRLDCVAYVERDPPERRALHVQSLSYWAPANIGPYSQAITAGERIFVSGQIGLIPSQLSLPSPQSLSIEIALSLQHVARIVEALRPAFDSAWIGCAQATLYWLVNFRDLATIKRAHQSVEGSEIPVLFLGVKELPRGALVEIQALLHTGRRITTEDGDRGINSQKPFYQKIVLDPSLDSPLYASFASFDAEEGCSLICGKGGLPPRSAISKYLGRAFHARLFYRASSSLTNSSLIHSLFESENCPPVTEIPCQFVSTFDHDNWDYAFCIMTL